MTRILDSHDPESYVHAHGQPKWGQAMQHELDSFQKNQTWDLVPRLIKNNVVKYKWVYHTEFTFNSLIEHHKACLVMKLFSQKEGIDYTETFFTCCKNETCLIDSFPCCSLWMVYSLYGC